MSHIGSAHPPSIDTEDRPDAKGKGPLAVLKSDHAALYRTTSPNPILANMMSSSVSELSKHNMNKFLSGFKRFHKNYFCDNIELFDHLRQAQSPKTLLIGCCDSRVDPAIITECDPGDMFVVRNVANLVAPYHPDGVSGFHGVSAAVEFAVKGLKVENIIVMGHTQCGGIKALMQGVSKDEYQFVGQWMSIVQLAKDKTLKNFPDAAPEVQQRACEHASILLSLENLMSYPWVKERLMKNEITINGWYFDFERGELLGYDVENNIFEPLVTFTENDSPTSPNEPTDRLSIATGSHSCGISCELKRKGTLVPHPAHTEDSEEVKDE